MTFQAFQRAFTAHIRDPRGQPRPRGVPARRMKVYNELLFNNVEGFLLACFPVCRAILGKRRWRRLARDFFRDHVCHTPYFRQIPEEFLKYLQDEWPAPRDYPAFLPELAHYEWRLLSWLWRYRRYAAVRNRGEAPLPHYSNGSKNCGRFYVSMKVRIRRWCGFVGGPPRGDAVVMHRER
jgi:hypothetical protein